MTTMKMTTTTHVSLAKPNEYLHSGQMQQYLFKMIYFTTVNIYVNVFNCKRNVMLILKVVILILKYIF